MIDFVFAVADFAIAASWSIGSAFPLRALAAPPALQGFLLATIAWAQTMSDPQPALTAIDIALEPDDVIEVGVQSASTKPS